MNYTRHNLLTMKHLENTATPSEIRELNHLDIQLRIATVSAVVNRAWQAANINEALNG